MKNRKARPLPTAKGRRKPINRKFPLILFGIILFFAALYATRPNSGMKHDSALESPIDLTPPARVPDQYRAGKQIFQENCSQCHGDWGQGSDQGPPLVHDIYKPSHHADIAFQRAVQLGVRAHHWPFGDMAPVPGVDMTAVNRIIPFIRWWQRQNGIHG